MRAMRNKVIHDYFDVELTVIWSTVKEDLPQLKQQIHALLIERRRGPTHEREQDTSR